MTAIAIGTDKSEKNVMKKKPRNPKESILDNTKAFIIVAGIVATIVTFAAFFYGLGIDIENGAGIDFLKTEEGFDFASKARTMAFTTLVVFELLFVFSSRGENEGVFENSPFNNPFLIKMVLISFVLQLLAIYGPVIATQVIPSLELSTINVFATVPLGIVDWVVVFALGATSVLVPYLAIAAKKIVKK